MSELKEGKTIVNVDRLHMLETTNRGQAETIGALKQTIINLDRQAAENEKRVTITEKGPEGIFRSASFNIKKTNLEDAASLIAEKVDKNNEAELKQTKSSLRSKENHIQDLEQSIKNIDAKADRKVDRMNADYIEAKFQTAKEYAKSNTDLKHKVQDLKDEIVKIKADKTDEQMEKTRKQEVAKLKSRINTLEREVTRLLSMSWFSRIWDKISKRNAKVEAEKQVYYERREANSVSTNSEAQNHIIGKAYNALTLFR